MNSLRAFSHLALVTGLFLSGVAILAAEEPAQHFRFGAGPGGQSVRMVAADDLYSKQRGCGFEPGLKVINVPGGVSGGPAFYFTTDLAEGNWRVKVTLQGAHGGGLVAVKAELRRLMVGPVRLGESEKLERTFFVNVRSPLIAARPGVPLGRVKLKEPRESVMEAWAWDGALTLEIDGEGAVLEAVDISPVEVPTIFLLGDSTVCDQPAEPYNSWGQMLPRFFKPDLAIANHVIDADCQEISASERL